MSAALPSEIQEQLPPLQPFSSLHLRGGDTLIHSPGFEDRTMAVLNGLTAESSARAILLHYEPANSRNRLSEVRAALSGVGVGVSNQDIITYDRFDPGEFETALAQRLRELNSRRAVVEISTMSKLAILLVLRVCVSLDLSIVILYSEASRYGPSQQEFEKARERNEIHRPSLHVFNGIHGVVRVASLSSVAMQGQPTAAIVFMSFNDALTQLLLNTVYPSRLFLINGRPPVHDWREAATAWVHEPVTREWADDNPVQQRTPGGPWLPSRVTSTLDYREATSLLLGLYWSLSPTSRVLLAPSGSKMQTVACFLLKALHPDIHIEYPSPEGFAPEYSFGSGSRWLLDLGAISRTLKTVTEAERHAYLEIE